ncbi:GNAT family N-acetyltransferase [Dyadobacter aurulentus]|uniref:GNAT family N-acetyltransferase n=1 Tax=Dyadobacter sp. UC 10 TaxID=2605428 RepID=UPI0011F31931|nr:GNAT family N-acetyltransferase [Dyadobacter sp. UC 10]KAA0992401.1 GNAT family N-acetyltransferase [Dyadobacter sp. UC 10]
MAEVSIHIRQLNPGDLPFCHRLVAEAGWNQTDADWSRAMELEPTGCFIAEKGHTPVATTTTCCFGSIAWIAMVLVDKRFRNQGIARQLLEHAIAYLESRKIATIRLDATSLGQGLYEKLGFEDEYEVIRFRREALLDNHVLAETSSRQLIEDIAGLDRQATKTGREALLSALRIQGSPILCKYRKNGQVEAYATGRPGTYAFQIGPVISAMPESALELLARMSAQYQSERVFIDIPSANVQSISWAEASGFVKQRSFIRMYRGQKIEDLVQSIWACFGPEKG